MRKVFSSHSQVCHVWAQQTQITGRAGNIFFEGCKVYSYGHHYLAGMIHTTKGKRFALVRSDTYSPSTSKHLSNIRGALSGLMPYFCVPNVQDPKAAVKSMDGSAQAQIESALKRMKVTRETEISWEFERIHDVHKDANELRKILGLKEVWPNKKTLDEVDAHLRKRLARYHELNTPEMIAKRDAERVKRALRSEAKLKKKLAVEIEKFRNGAGQTVYGLPHELLRRTGNVVETSRGAQVPLEHAVKLFCAIVKGKNVIGARVGHFSVNAVYPVFNPGMPDDKLLHIGCHRILLSEATQALNLKEALCVE